MKPNFSFHKKLSDHKSWSEQSERSNQLPVVPPGGWTGPLVFLKNSSWIIVITSMSLKLGRIPLLLNTFRNFWINFGYSYNQSRGNVATLQCKPIMLFSAISHSHGYWSSTKVPHSRIVLTLLHHAYLAESAAARFSEGTMAPAIDSTTTRHEAIVQNWWQYLWPTSNKSGRPTCP